MLNPTPKTPTIDEADRREVEREIADRIRELERAYMRAMDADDVPLARVLLDSLCYQWNNWRE